MEKRVVFKSPWLPYALVAPQLSAAVELGAAFDVLVTTFIGLALLRTLHQRGLLDVDYLRNLRG